MCVSAFTATATLILRLLITPDVREMCPVCQVIGAFGDPVRMSYFGLHVCMLRICTYLCCKLCKFLLQINPDIWKKFYPNHTCCVSRGGQQVLLKTSICKWERPYGEGNSASLYFCEFHALQLVCSWYSSKHQSGTSWPYKENKEGIWAGLAKMGPDSNIPGPLPIYSILGFATSFTSRPILHVFPIFPRSK